MSCHSCVKYLMFFVNILFSIFGLGIIVFGTVTLIFRKNLELVDTPIYYFVGIIVLGAIVFLVGFTGCFGAIQEVDCLLLTHSTILLLLVIAKIAIIVVLFKFKPEWKDEITTFLRIDEDIPTPPVLNGTNAIEYHLIESLGRCCGSTGPDSYEIDGHSLDELPITCCPVSFSKELTCPKEKARELGCSTNKALENIMNIVDILSYTVIGITLFEVAGFFTAIYLSCSSKDRRRGYHEYD